jgi:hypothetical protein
VFVDTPLLGQFDHSIQITRNQESELLRIQVDIAEEKAKKK